MISVTADCGESSDGLSDRPSRSVIKVLLTEPSRGPSMGPYIAMGRGYEPPVDTGRSQSRVAAAGTIM